MGVLASTIAALQAATACPYDPAVAAQAQAQSDIATALTQAQSVDVAPVYPAWRQGLPIGQWSPIIGTAQLSGLQWKPPQKQNQMSGAVNDWTTLCSVGMRVFGGIGGHFNWQNAIPVADLDADAPTWSWLLEGSDYAAVPTVDQPYYNDGLPRAVHGYFAWHGVDAVNARDGIDRLMRLCDYGGYPSGGGGGPRVNSVRLDTNQYDPTWPSAPFAVSYVLFQAQDPRTGDVYVSINGGYLYKWATTGSWSLYASYNGANGTTPKYPAAGYLEVWSGGLGGAVDPKRNRVFVLSNHGGTLHLQMVALDAPVVTSLVLVNPPAALVASGYVAVEYIPETEALYADRYVVYTAAGNGFAINPDTGTVESLPALTSAPINGMFNRLRYLPGLGGLVALPCFASPLLFLPTH